jgi:hypothetical protein
VLDAVILQFEPGYELATTGGSAQAGPACGPCGGSRRFAIISALVKLLEAAGIAADMKEQAR